MKRTTILGISGGPEFEVEVGVKVGIDGEKTSDDGGRVENGRFGMKSFPYAKTLLSHQQPTSR